MGHHFGSHWRVVGSAWPDLVVFWELVGMPGGHSGPPWGMMWLNHHACAQKWGGVQITVGIGTREGVGGYIYIYIYILESSGRASRGLDSYCILDIARLNPPNARGSYRHQGSTSSGPDKATVPLWHRTLQDQRPPACNRTVVAPPRIGSKTC